MYTSEVNTKEEALCHLFLHCCYKDGDFKEKELDFVSGLFVQLELNNTLNFKDQLQKYKSYKELIANEVDFLNYLIKKIHPVHTLALYSYCIEVVLSDAHLDISEEKLLQNLAITLEIDEDKQAFLKTLTAQRRAVELEKIF